MFFFFFQIFSQCVSCVFIFLTKSLSEPKFLFLSSSIYQFFFYGLCFWCCIKNTFICMNSFFVDTRVFLNRRSGCLQIKTLNSFIRIYYLFSSFIALGRTSSTTVKSDKKSDISALFLTPWISIRSSIVKYNVNCNVLINTFFTWLRI